MPTYTPPLRDMRFVMHELLHAIDELKRLPAHELSRKTYKGKSVWVYPDQNICACLYIGSQTAYNAYIKKASAKMISAAVRANDSDNPYSPTASVEEMDYDWANDPQAYGLYSDW